MNISTVISKVKWPFAKIAALYGKLRSGRLYPIALSKWEGVVVYLTVFVISEILISGGRYDRNYFLFAVNLITILTVSLFFSIKRPIKPIRQALSRGATTLITFAVLDFLIVNLLLLKNNLAIYNSWQTYVAYALVLLVPIVASRFGKKRFTTPEELEAAIQSPS